MKLNSKRVVLSAALAMGIAAFAMVGCEKSGLENARVSHVSFTECKSHANSMEEKGMSTPDTVSIRYEAGTVYVDHYHLGVNCAFDTVNVALTMNDDTIRILEYGTPDEANCICETNNSFQIDNVPHGTYTIIVENFYPAPYQHTYHF